MPPVRTLILGGGMSGLSCAYHLKKDYLLLEKSDEPGGLSRSVRKDGFVFDHTGHLLHLRNPYTLKLIPALLGDNLVENSRRAWIASHGVYTRYPYQANLYGLPREVIRECLQGLIEAQLKSPGPSAGAAQPGRAPESLRSWVLRTFGRGFGRHFFFPYNRKLWTVGAQTLTAEWVAPFVPRPSIEETILGAGSDQSKAYGYNATFFYPREGGIQALAFAFARGLGGIRLNTEVSRIDLDRRRVATATGETFEYRFLVNTLPLSRFLAMAEPRDPDIRQRAARLRWSSVYNLNLGVDRPQITDKHWIYFPEKRFVFYRVGFPMNFAPAMAPPGASSMYVEIAHPPGRPPGEAWALRRTLAGLREAGILRPSDKVRTRMVLPIPIAYVTYDAERTAAAGAVLRWLSDQGVQSIGRFGGWKYSYMEEAILEGQRAAETILGDSSG